MSFSYSSNIAFTAEGAIPEMFDVPVEVEPSSVGSAIEFSDRLLAHAAVVGRMKVQLPVECVLDFIYEWCRPVAASSKLYAGTLAYRVFELAVAPKLPQLMATRGSLRDARHQQALRWLIELASLPRDVVVGDMSTGRSNLAFLSRKLGLIPRPMGAVMLSAERR